MSGRKKIDFNNQEDVEKTLKSIQKSTKNPKSIPDRVINFATNNMMLVAILAIYFVISGIVGTFVFIFSNPFTSVMILALSLSFYFIYKLMTKKNGK